MNANQNEQLSGGCRDIPGASKYVVQGQTFRYRRYLGSIGLMWDASVYGWTGRLSDGRAWYLREKLGLDVELAGKTHVYTPLPTMPKEPVRLVRLPERPKRDNDEPLTGWEAYSAEPVRTSRDARIREGLNINERSCHWGVRQER